MNTEPKVAERPILFSGAMVKAILAGTKTQTRRTVKPQPPDDAVSGGIIWDKNGPRPSPYGRMFERLWVRETWATPKSYDCQRPRDCAPTTPLFYAADSSHGKLVRWTDEEQELGRLRPSIFLPRWASRITLEIESVRVERLQNISEEDAESEGCELPPCTYIRNCRSNSCPRHGRLDRWSNAYRLLWESINGKGSWARNDFVWVISFHRITPTP